MENINSSLSTTDKETKETLEQIRALKKQKSIIALAAMRCFIGDMAKKIVQLPPNSRESKQAGMKMMMAIIFMAAYWHYSITETHVGEELDEFIKNRNLNLSLFGKNQVQQFLEETKLTIDYFNYFFNSIDDKPNSPAQLSMLQVQPPYIIKKIANFLDPKDGSSLAAINHAFKEILAPNLSLNYVNLFPGAEYSEKFIKTLRGSSELKDQWKVLKMVSVPDKKTAVAITCKGHLLYRQIPSFNVGFGLSPMYNRGGKSSRRNPLNPPEHDWDNHKNYQLAFSTEKGEIIAVVDNESAILWKWKTEENIHEYLTELKLPAIKNILFPFQDGSLLLISNGNGIGLFEFQEAEQTYTLLQPLINTASVMCLLPTNKLFIAELGEDAIQGSVWKMENRDRRYDKTNDFISLLKATDFPLSAISNPVALTPAILIATENLGKGSRIKVLKLIDNELLLDSVIDLPSEVQAMSNSLIRVNACTLFIAVTSSGGHPVEIEKLCPPAQYPAYPVARYPAAPHPATPDPVILFKLTVNSEKYTLSPLLRASWNSEGLVSIFSISDKPYSFYGMTQIRSGRSGERVKYATVQLAVEFLSAPEIATDAERTILQMLGDPPKQKGNRHTVKCYLEGLVKQSTFWDSFFPQPGKSTSSSVNKKKAFPELSESLEAEFQPGSSSSRRPSSC